jgi:hypothetical protein
MGQSYVVHLGDEAARPSRPSRWIFESALGRSLALPAANVPNATRFPVVNKLVPVSNQGLST